jgi:hypothetical protein
VSTTDLGPSGEAIRFTDILTTAAAIADYLAAESVAPEHLANAVDVLTGERRMADFGRPVSPLVRRSKNGAVDEPVRALVQRWFEALGGKVSATLTVDQVAVLRHEIEGLGRFE